MANGHSKVIARIDVGSKIEGGGLHVIRDIFEQHFAHKIRSSADEDKPRAQLNNDGKQLLVYGDVTKKELEEFVTKRVEETYQAQLDYLGGYTLDDINALNAEHDEALNKHRLDCVTRLKTQQSDYERKLTTAHQEHATLEAEHDEVKQRNAALSKELNKAYSRVEEIVNAHSSHKVNVWQVARAAGRIAQFESELTSLEGIVDVVGAAGISEKVHSIEHAVELINKYVKDQNSAENIYELFAEKNKERSDIYEKAKKELASLQKEKEKVSTKKRLPKKFLEGSMKLLNESIAEQEAIMQSYEQDRASFIKRVQEPLAKISDKLQGSVKGTLPVYLTVTESDTQYIIDMYVPFTEKQQTDLKRTLGVEKIVDEKIGALIDKHREDPIGEEIDHAHQLVFYRIAVPKDKYTVKEIRHVRSELEHSIRTAAYNTVLCKLGYDIELLVRDTLLSSSETRSSEAHHARKQRAQESHGLRGNHEERLTALYGLLPSRDLAAKAGKKDDTGKLSTLISLLGTKGYTKLTKVTLKADIKVLMERSKAGAVGKTVSRRFYRI